MGIRQAKSARNSTNKATFATGRLALKKCTKKRQKLAQNTLYLQFHRDVLVPPPPCQQCKQRIARC